jgi:hypothetical protein
MQLEDHKPRLEDYFITRRDFLRRCGIGMGTLGLATLLDSMGSLASTRQTNKSFPSPLVPKMPHFPSRAKRVIHLFMQGGPSHVDTFDPKPMLEKHAGKFLKDIDKSVTHPGAAFPSPFKFRKFGQSGIDVSELFPYVAEHVDEIAVIRSMTTTTPSHENAMMMINCGDQRLLRPCVGSWVTYGLGTENQNLPGFIAMSPRNRPLLGDENWRSAFLPGIYQGTYIDTKYTQIEELIEFIQSSSTSTKEQRRQLDLLHYLNEQHSQKRARDSQLETRIQTFETAYRMQLEATDAFDITKEPDYIRAMYGEGEQGRQILIARRLIERGVRFVQVWQNGWDHHNLLEEGSRKKAKEIDQPIGALLTDLKNRGMLDDTLIIWAGEFGRTPTGEATTIDQSKGKGRDHNNRGFSIWMAGGGVKGGYIHGATDEWGFAAIEKKMDIADFHATILYLLGLDHEKLTFRHAGRDFRLTDVAGNVIKELIA